MSIFKDLEAHIEGKKTPTPPVNDWNDLHNDSRNTMKKLEAAHEEHLANKAKKLETMGEQWAHMKPRHKVQTLAFGRSCSQHYAGHYIHTYSTDRRPPPR